MHILREVLGRTAVRRFLPVQVLGVLLAVGGLSSVSTPFGIGDIIVRTPIVLSNAAAHVMRAVADSTAKVSAVGGVRPSRGVAPAEVNRTVSRQANVVRPVRLDAGRNPETIRMKGPVMRPARAGVTAAAGITTRQTVKPAVAKAVRQHRRDIEQRNRHRISPIRAPRRPHRAPFTRPLHRP